ncbi:zgc:103586 isoform X2 [Brienomyrus brachyistius]|uniref:zgc:103586 isoform X2 n=1 Tax=Brienomyrus brachyistius TaxID=42636 RepID=UPI0020B23609|nr:zgc:103586 isoform X2 [Brienomyrus brachyistius]
MEPVENALHVGGSSCIGYMGILPGLLPLSTIALGSMHINDCPKQPYIPIYLLVFGLVGLLLQVQYFLCKCCTQCNNPVVESLSTACRVLLCLFAVCWLITGSVWIYSIFPPNYESPRKPDYCEKTMYLFAFWTHNAIYVFTVLFLIYSTCAFLYRSLC